MLWAHTVTPCCFEVRDSANKEKEYNDKPEKLKSYLVSLPTGLSLDLQSAGDSFSDAAKDKEIMLSYVFSSSVSHPLSNVGSYFYCY